ncbi:MAG: amidohydrolase family protein, partial [Alphaproteobacteria bacterium]|nr:amidohydrolase family protein [Alphaproteobacteria bacterium]
MRCDLIIEGASVIDGTGAPAQVTDVAVESGRILALGDLLDWTADERIKGAGQCLAPGFIDVHTHDDLAVFDTPDMLFKTSQGVTTVVAGNCGISVAPFHSHNICPEPLSLLGNHSAFAYPTVGAYRAQLDQKPAAVNLALLVGHTSLRVTAMGADLDRPATLAETGAMADA